MHIYDSKENHRMITNEELIEKAFEAMKNAYAPYSNYHVGACVLCNDGTTFNGANIENASFGATNCGERSAVLRLIQTVIAAMTSRRSPSYPTVRGSVRPAASAARSYRSC